MLLVSSQRELPTRSLPSTAQIRPASRYIEREVLRIAKPAAERRVRQGAEIGDEAVRVDVRAGLAADPDLDAAGMRACGVLQAGPGPLVVEIAEPADRHRRGAAHALASAARLRCLPIERACLGILF
jgi:hypothetical protein